ncbi:hypothetical protein MSIBF_A1980009 [groundwater metagenome]|uniref:Uncharacterized protein n=1 Tax=groundwater metagenome TaxID=717931 RepID=A0A098E9E2_9ZZZZ
MYVLFCASADLKDAKYIRKDSKNLLQMKFGICDTLAMCGKVVDCNRTKFGVMLTLNDGENFVITAGTFNKNALQDADNVLQKFYGGNKEIYLLLYANPFYREAIYLNANQDYSVIEVTKQIYEKFHEIRKKGLTYLMEKFNKNMVSEKEKAKEQKEERETKEQKEERETKEQKEEMKTKEQKEEKIETITEEKTTTEEKKEKKETFEEYKEYEIKEALMGEEEYKKQGEINLTVVQFVENLAKNKKDNVIGIEEVTNELTKSEKFYSLNINWTDKIYELLEMGYFYEPKPGYIKPIT